MLPPDETSGTSSVPENTSTAGDVSSQANAPSSASSFSPDTTTGPQAAQPPGDNPASPPDAPTDDRSALLAIVKQVTKVEPKNPAGEGKPAVSDGSSATEAKPDPAAALASAIENDPTEEEFKGMTPRTKARVEKLLEQRHAARQEADALKPHAAKWQQMDGYLKKHNLAAEDANTLLGVGAALRRGDFKAFLDGVQPYVDHARQALGQLVPNDLQAKVDTGELSEDAAKQLTVARIANARLQGEVRANTDAQTAQRQADAQAHVMATVNTAITTWEQGIRARDPDYAKMAPEVEAEARLLIAAHGHVKSVEEATAIADRAYARVKRMFSAGRPAPVATPKQPSGARAVNGARAEPRNLMEAAMQGLERARA
jgi:hypothetical protein